MLRIIHENGWLEFSNEYLQDAISFRDENYPYSDIWSCEDDTLIEIVSPGSPVAPEPPPDDFIEPIIP